MKSIDSDLQLTELPRIPKTISSLAKFTIPRRGSYHCLEDLHRRALVVKEAGFDENMLRRYEKVCGLNKQAFLPVLFPQVVLSPMQLALFSDKRFPISMLGAVHKRNKIIQHREISIDDVFDANVALDAWRVLDKGIEFDVINELKDEDGELAWQSRSTYFVKKAKRPLDLKPEQEPGLGFLRISEHSNVKVHRWHLDQNKGKEYARITGDYNPIHVSRVAAKVFGFQRDLVHGFCLLAMCLEKIPETSASQLNNQLFLGANQISLDVEFKGPNYLGEALMMRHQREGLGHRMDVYCGANDRPTMLIGVHA